MRGLVVARSAARRVEVRRPRVLIVDDLGYARDALAELLRSAGYDVAAVGSGAEALDALEQHGADLVLDRKSTRLNSSHPSISYAVFCLKKKKKKTQQELHVYNNT